MEDIEFPDYYTEPTHEDDLEENNYEKDNIVVFQPNDKYLIALFLFLLFEQYLDMSWTPFSVFLMLA